jgi:RNA polymerase sigma factor (sigma-70 family)
MSDPKDDIRNTILCDPHILKYMRAVARLRGVPRQDVDDVVQIALLEAIAHHKLPLHPEHARKYLGTIVRRRAIDHARQRNAAREADSRASIADGPSDPASTLVARRIVAWLERTLSPRHIAWLEAFAQGDTADEIARRDGVTPSYVRARLARLRQMLARVSVRWQ